jgi:hypothetical protein
VPSLSKVEVVQPPPPLEAPLSTPIIDICAGAALVHSNPMIAKSVRSLRIEVSMTSGPERPDAAKGDQRSPDAMD